MLPRPAGGVYGQLLAEKQGKEIKKSLPADHKITDVIKEAGERRKSRPADERQKMDAMEIPRTSSSTVNTMMMQSRKKHAIWRKLSLCARPTRELNAIVYSAGTFSRELNAIVYSAGTFSNRNKVKVTSLYVVERINIMMGLMPKGDMGQSSDEREDLRHERDRMKHVRCRDV